MGLAYRPCAASAAGLCPPHKTALPQPDQDDPNDDTGQHKSLLPDIFFLEHQGAQTERNQHIAASHHTQQGNQGARQGQGIEIAEISGRQEQAYGRNGPTPLKRRMLPPLGPPAKDKNQTQYNHQIETEVSLYHHGRIMAKQILIV